MTPGWFDLPAPVLDGVDQVLAMALPEWLRVAIYGLVVSYLGMVIYSRVSNQGRLRAVQRLTRRVRRRLHDPEIAFDALLAASRRSLVLSLRHLGLVLLPSLFTLLPLLFVLPWASNRFGAALPAVGTPVTWCARPIERAAAVRVGDAPMDETGCVTAPWPAAQQPIRLDDHVIATAPWRGPSEVLHARHWWNRFIGNPAGELPERVGDLEIHVAVPPHLVLTVGPPWFGHWLVWFLVPGLFAGFYCRGRRKLV